LLFGPAAAEPRPAPGEFGADVKPDAALKAVVSYPDLYEIGMSNAAIRILYSLLNSLPDVSCERVFAPAPDFEGILRDARMPLFSLETARPISDFDIVCFSIGYELTLTNLLAILETGGVGLLRESRGPGEPIVIAGGPATTNPVPLIYVAEEAKRFRLRPDGSLRDISPTLLNILNLGLPKEMTGGDLRVPLAK